MADDQFIWVETNEEEVLRKFDAATAHQKFRARELMDDLSDAGVQLLRINAPEYSSYLQRHISREPINRTVGATGDELLSTVGVKRGTSAHPIYVEFGTGIYAQPSRGYITPKQGEYMYFPSSLYGRLIRVKKSKGQPPQRYFYRTWLELNVYAKARILGSKLV